MVAMAIWRLLIKNYFYRFVLDTKVLKVTKKSAFYTGWRKRYGRLNKNMAESAAPPPPLDQIILLIILRAQGSM